MKGMHALEFAETDVSEGKEKKNFVLMAEGDELGGR